jgi:hypothetical protein
MFAVTEQGIAAEKSYRPYISAGHAADSPANEPRTATDGRHPESGQFRTEAAAGHGVTSDGAMDRQPPRTPLPMTALSTVRPPMGALCSAYDEHPGTAMVSQLDASSAASPGLAGQLVRNMPSGVPVQPAPHVAPTGPGAEFRVSPGRSMGGGPVSLPGAGGRAAQ